MWCHHPPTSLRQRRHSRSYMAYANSFICQYSLIESDVQSLSCLVKYDEEAVVSQGAVVLSSPTTGQIFPKVAETLRS